MTSLQQSRIDAGRPGAPAGRVGVGIIGLGMALQPHAEALRQLADQVEVVAAWSPDPARRAAAAARHGLPVVASESAVFDDPRIAVVLVLTPPRTHGALALRAAAAGKHALIEKPLTVESAEARRLVDAFDRAGLRLGVVFQHRFRAAPIALRELLADDGLGRLISVSASIRWWRSPEYFAQPGRGTLARDGGGVLLTQAIHTLDLMLDLAGPVATVASHCVGSGLRAIDTEDVAAGVVRFANGAIGVIDATTVAYPGFAERIEFAGSAGTAWLEGDHLRVQRPDRPPIELAGGSGGGGGADPMAFSADAHRRMIGAFVDAVVAGREPANSGRSALRVQALIDGMLASSAAGGAPVAVAQGPSTRGPGRGSA